MKTIQLQHKQQSKMVEFW